MAAVDKADAAHFSRDDILEPHGWDYSQLPHGSAHRPRPLPRLPDLQLPADDAAHRRRAPTKSIEEILQTPDVTERVELYREHADAADRPGRRCATVHGNLVVLDLRDEDPIFATNRFTVYALFPSATSRST